MAMKRALFIGSLAVGVVHAALAETVWPGGDVRVVPGRNVRVQERDGFVMASVGKCDPGVWPAVHFQFKAPRDLSQVASIRITFTNATALPLPVSIKVKGETLQGRLPDRRFSVPSGGVHRRDLELFAESWAFDKDPGLVGLKRNPYVGGGSSYSLEKVNSITVYLRAGTEDVEFGVGKVELVPASQSEPGANAPHILKADSFFPWVDEFGQANFVDYEDKVHSREEFAVRAEAEAKDLAAHPEGIPGADRFGGWAEGPQLQATGFFRTEKLDGKWWLVDPDGHLFFVQGVNFTWDYAATGVSGREKFFEKLPPREGETKQFWEHVKKPMIRNYYCDATNVPFWAFSFNRYNLWLKHGDEWRRKNAENTVKRMKAWGINLTASHTAFNGSGNCRIPYITYISPTSRPIEGSKGYWGKLIDPFAPEFAESCRRCAENNRNLGTNEWCIGWTANNEQSWGENGEALARSVLDSPAGQPARIALMEMLADKGLTPETATGEDLRMMGEAIIEKYYATVRAAIKAVAPNHLYMGDRNDKLNPELFRAASRQLDVITVNIYDHVPARHLPSGSDDKPFLVTEFHFGCYDTGYFYASLIPVKDQAERAQCYRTYMRAAIDNPNYVGALWFCWRDCPITGQTNEGANAQCGMVSTSDVPYAKLTEAVRDIAAEMYRRRRNKAQTAQK